HRGGRSRRRRDGPGQHEPRRHAAGDVPRAGAPVRQQGAPGAEGPHRRRSMTARGVASTLAAFAMLFGPGVVRAAQPAPDLVARGKYVFGTAGGCGCHTAPEGSRLHPGGTKFELSVFGVVYAPNITPDVDTGIGKWTDAQVINAIRRGERPDGTKLFPIHPYKYLSNIADDEIEALVAYLRSVKPVKSSVPARSLKIPVPTRTITTAVKT